MRVLKRTSAGLLCLILLLSLCGIGTTTVCAAQTLTVRYTFTGDEASKAGFAEGTIEITPQAGGLSSGYYLVYYANAAGTLAGYDELASVRITGSTVTHKVKDGTRLPEKATAIAVFESPTRFLDDTPAIEKAAAILELPASKRLSLGTPQLTFGAISDVHMNYEGAGRGSYQKWENALNFFAAEGMDYVIVTGDMTGDTSLDAEYQTYLDIIDRSDFPADRVYEGIGNHGNTPSTKALFAQYTSGPNEVRPFAGSTYYHVLIEGATATARDNLFIFMAQEMNGPDDSEDYDNFSKAQIDWLEGLLKQYGNTDTNIFITLHSPFLNFGPGDRHGGGYTMMVTFKPSYTQTMRLKGLLETYKDAVVMSGHTHLTLYDTENYSDEYNSFARMVHVGSGCYPNGYGAGTVFSRGTDGRYSASASYGSEGYLVEVYADYISYTGYNLSTGKIIPGACLLMPTHAYGGAGRPEPDPAPDLYAAFEGAGTADDPYRIADAADFKALTDGFNASTSSVEEEMFGYGKYFEQTADIDMTGIADYAGTAANGGAKCFFAGAYNGGGHTLRVAIQGSGQRSVFPYVYGVLYNLNLKGSITCDDSAQPIRTSYGYVVHSLFDLSLSGGKANGLLYTNYSGVYNVYTGGTAKGSSPDALSVTDTSKDYVGVYHCYVNADGAAVTDTYGTRSADASAVATALNDRSSDAYKKAQAAVGTGTLCEVTVQGGTLGFKPLAAKPTTTTGSSASAAPGETGTTTATASTAASAGTDAHADEDGILWVLWSVIGVLAVGVIFGGWLCLRKKNASSAEE